MDKEEMQIAVSRAWDLLNSGVARWSGEEGFYDGWRLFESLDGLWVALLIEHPPDYL